MTSVPAFTYQPTPQPTPRTALQRPRVTLSVVSHGHGAQVLEMLHSFARSGLAELWHTDAVVTLNIPEPALQEALQQAARQACWPFAVRIIHNRRPQGFGANHNQALSASGARWFCIVNPDVLWTPVPAQSLPAAILATLQLPGDRPGDDPGRAGQGGHPASRPVGLYCPAQVNPAGQLQDYARQLPLPWGVAGRALQRLRGRAATRGVAANPERADWVNGACMLFSASAYRQLGGFDPRYFLYGEDVDICLRLQLQGYTIASLPLTVVHHAQRNTARQWRHLAWHLRSLLRLWCSRSFWRYVARHVCSRLRQQG